MSFRVVGFVDSTQATAGTWAAAPSTVQGVGGQALAAMSSLGYGQQPTDMTGSRVSGTTYTNTRGKPILCIVAMNSSSSVSATVGGVLIYSGTTAAANFHAVSFMVPPGVTYSATGFFRFLEFI